MRKNQAQISIKWLLNVQYKLENCEEEEGSQYEDRTDSDNNVLGVAIADAAANPSVGEGSHTSPEECRVHKIHKCIVP